MAILAVLGVSLVWWRCRRSARESSAFRWVTVLTLAVTVMVMPKAAPYNQVLLLPGILLAIQERKVLWTQESADPHRRTGFGFSDFMAVACGHVFDYGCDFPACPNGARGLGRSALHQRGNPNRGGYACCCGPSRVR